MSFRFPLAYATLALASAFPLDMAPPSETVIQAAMGPSTGSMMHFFLPHTAAMQWFNSSPEREREYGLPRRAQERGNTDSFNKTFPDNILGLPSMGLTGNEAWNHGLRLLPLMENSSIIISLLCPSALSPTRSEPRPFTANTTLKAHALFSRARIKAVHTSSVAELPTAVEVYTTQPDPLVHALVFGMWLVAVWCACAVIFDLALAVLGAMLHVATVHPQIIRHAILCIIRACMLIINQPYTVSLIVCMNLISLLPTSEAAGKDQPSTNTYEYVLPGVTRWDGTPFHDFRLIWWVALCAALGSISQDSYSLLQTARDEDLGGPAVGGTGAQRTQSANRNQRLFGSILNYIEATSYIYRFATSNFNNDGRGLFTYLYVFGHLPYTPEQLTELENEWAEATMSKSRIKFDENAVFKWAEYVTLLAEKLNKNERQKRTKYLNGFPSSFDVVVVPERQQGAVGSYVHPANYPVHDPRHSAAVAAALAVTPPVAPVLAHPLAGEPDIMAMAHGFYPEWARMIKQGMIKAVPRGMAYQAHEVDSDGANEDENCDAHAYDAHAFLARERVTNQTVCIVCGGIGHAANVDGMYCLTTVLGHRVPPADLNRMTYPDGYTPPRRSNPNPRFSNSRSHTQQNDPRRRSHSNPRFSHASSSRSHARAVDDGYDSHEYGFESMTSDEITALAASINAEHARRNRPRHRPRPGPRRNSHVRFRDPRQARQAEEEVTPQETPQETQQNSTPHDDADAYSDPEEHHGMLAVALAEIDFL